jgi:hypothetical protein
LIRFSFDSEAKHKKLDLGEAEKTRETRLTLNCQTFHGQRHLSSWKSFFRFFWSSAKAIEDLEHYDKK